ncbi:unnamed protein product [Alopecurus aequalis]
MDDGTSGCVDFRCTDILVEVLQRLPPNTRRLCRLVSRRWRDAVDKRTATDLRSRAKTLLVTRNGRSVLDDSWRVKPLMACRQEDLAVVGTCNGLICFCDDTKPGGSIVLVNPDKGERLVLPPLPCADILSQCRPWWHEAYGFAHNQSTGRYTVVHIPCCFSGIWEFHTVQVFTLGGTSWRDVATPAVGGVGVACLRKAGVVSVDGATYWVAEATERIMSFDLEKERVTSVQPLPVPLPTRSGSSFRLAEVHGRLGMAIFNDSAKLARTDVWVLESARGEQRWRLWYSVEVVKVRHYPYGVGTPCQWMTLPHFAHGDHVLAHGGGILYRHEPNGTRKKSRYGMVQIGERNTGKIAATGRVEQAFAYVETKEPLDIYRLW